MAPRTLAVSRGPLPRAFGASTGVARRPTQSEALSRQRRPTRRATFASAHRQDLGSTSSMSAAIELSGAWAAASASGSNGDPGQSVRRAVASFVRPKSAAARPRVALLLARTARRPLPASSPPWPNTPMNRSRCRIRLAAASKTLCRGYTGRRTRFLMRMHTPNADSRFPKETADIRTHAGDGDPLCRSFSVLCKG
jgi:hypothetical protein